MKKISDYHTISQHPILQEVTDVLCAMVRRDDPAFFRSIAIFYLAQMATCMRATISSPIFKTPQPANVFIGAFATSGYGKGYSVHLMENQFLSSFKKKFMRDTFPTVADDQTIRLAIERAAYSGRTEEEERQRIEAQNKQLGPYPFIFKTATPAALTQVYDKTVLNKIGAISLKIDEIGLNLVGNPDIIKLMPIFLELWDLGMTGQSLLKNTNENQRFDPLDGESPTNLLMFGTPTKLFDGGLTEKTFFELLNSGLARRFIYAWGDGKLVDEEITEDELLDKLMKQADSKIFARLTRHFGNLADPSKYGWEMNMPDETTRLYLRYNLDCIKLVKDMKEHEDTRQNEMENRHSKALKLAGVLAFVDESLEITPDHFLQAVKIVEESGKAFNRIMSPEPAYEKLARFLSEAEGPQTHVELMALPCFKQAKQTDQQIMMSRATQWGYRNHIIIRKTYEDGIEFLEGETLEQTDLNQMIISYSSDHEAYGYETEMAPFHGLDALFTQDAWHWSTHRFQGGHRKNDNVIPGFNLIVGDVDGTSNLEFVHKALKDYTFMTYTTKRHTDEEHRFRLVMPLQYILHLSVEDYREFMKNVLLWLPFQSDPTSDQIAKKWLTCASTLVHKNQGELFDPMPFIPKTSRNEEFKKGMKDLVSLDNLERWFASRMVDGDRSNQMIKYALALVDSGMSIVDIERAVRSFNSRLSNGLPDTELRSTVLVTAAKKAVLRDAA